MLCQAFFQRRCSKTLLLLHFALAVIKFKSTNAQGNDSYLRADEEAGRKREFELEEQEIKKYSQSFLYDENDELCFNKIRFPSDTPMVPGDSLPMTIKDYPIHGDFYVYEMLTESMCPSVTLPDDREVTQDVEELIDVVGGPPSHATKRDPASDFWREFRVVCDVQLLRRLKGHQPGSMIMPLPDLWENFTINDVAEAVHDEYPGYHQGRLLERLFADGIKIDNDIIPKRSEAQFLRGPVMLSYLNQWAIRKVGPTNFAAKYYVGRARPEEVAWAVAKDKITRGDVPHEDIITNVHQMNLETPERFTAYSEGCPMHPSWPAMHSAASSLSMWLPVVADLTEEQLLQAKLTDYAVAYARTVAGVHYSSDNDDGLNMGQEIVARELPRQLAKLVGSDPKKVEKKIRALRFDWRYLSSQLTDTFHVPGAINAVGN